MRLFAECTLDMAIGADVAPTARFTATAGMWPFSEKTGSVPVDRMAQSRLILTFADTAFVSVCASDLKTSARSDTDCLVQ